MNYIISQQLAQAVLDYLVQQPYREVAPLIAGLQQMIQPPAPPSPPLQAG